MAQQIWLGLDPGKASYAATVLRYDTETHAVKFLYVGFISNPIKNLTANPVRDKKRRGKKTLERDEPSLDVGLHLYSDEVLWLLTNFGVTHLAGERFQVRGRFRGDLVELINVMLGITFMLAHQCQVRFKAITAGVWKNAVGRQGCNLEEVYRRGKIEFKLEPHVIDSTLIALWHANGEIHWWAKPKLLKAIRDCLTASAA